MSSDSSEHQVQIPPNAPHTIVIEQKPAEAPVNAGIATLLATWGFLLLPVPIVSAGMATVLGIATLVISIICMVRGKVGIGAVLLAADLIGSLIFYLLGIAIMILLFGATH